MSKKNMWKCPVTRYGAGQKKATSGKALHGMNISVFRNKDSPDYKPNYGSTFTERQMKIINEEIPLSNVRANEIMIIIRKAEALGEDEIVATAKTLYNLKTQAEVFKIDLSVDEAKDILQSLTPWEINWKKED